MRCSPMLPTVAFLCLTLGGCGTATRYASRAYHALPFTGKAARPGGGALRTNGLSLKMQLSPLPAKLSDQRQINVRIRLENISKRFIQLQFPTSQRIEILVRDETGRIVTQWSEDRSFDPTVGYVGINPGEHVEYATTIPTRDLQAGKRYTVSGFFPNFEELKIEQTIVPQP